MIDAVTKKLLQDKYGDEHVLVVDFLSVKEIPDKFSSNKISTDLSRFKTSRFILRSDAEYNPNFIQIIPYILVTNKNHDKLYITKRIAGEERLKDSLALGCGGHINPCDMKGKNVIYNAANREMNEELNIETILFGTSTFRIVGTVRDLSSTTSDHLGIVLLAAAENVNVKEKDNLQGMWMDYLELTNNYSKFESWARHILDYICLNNGDIDSLLK